MYHRKFFFNNFYGYLQIDVSSWQEGFFALTMVCVVIINSSVAVFQSSLFGMASKLPSLYIQALMAGQVSVDIACFANLNKIGLDVIAVHLAGNGRSVRRRRAHRFAR